MKRQRLIQSSFNRAAPNYRQHAYIQKHSATTLIELFKHDLEQIKHPISVLDAGCGCCFNAALPNQIKQSIGIDIAFNMLQQLDAQHTQHELVCADLEKLPLQTASLDVVFSNASIHWCSNPAQALAEFHRTLKPSGIVLFNSYGPQTLHELRKSWQVVDTTPHTLDFFSTQQLRQALVQNNFEIIACHQQNQIVWHNNVLELLEHLKQLGVRNLHQSRHRGLSSSKKLSNMMQKYTKDYQHNNKIPASYELLFFCARAL